MQQSHADQVRVSQPDLVDEDQGHPTRMLEVAQWLVIRTQLGAHLGAMRMLGQGVGQLDVEQLSRRQDRAQAGEEALAVFDSWAAHERNLRRRRSKRKTPPRVFRCAAAP